MIYNLIYKILHFYRYFIFFIFYYPLLYITEIEFFEKEKKEDKIFEYMNDKDRLWNELIQHPKLYNELKREKCRIFYRRCNERLYSDILILLIEDNRYHIKDYYDYYLEVYDKNDIMKRIHRNVRLLNHISKYIKKYKKKMDNETNMIYDKHKGDQNEMKECMVCYDEIKKNHLKIICKTCKVEMDDVCFKRWFQNQNQCILCRTPYIQEEEYEKSRRNSIIKKYIEYRYFLERKIKNV